MKSGSLSIETQTEDNQIIIVCHINEKSIALETSPEAKKLFSLNKKLFNKINKRSRLAGGKIIRQSVVRTKNHVNRLMVKVDNSFEHEERTIASLIFEEGKLIKSLERRKFGKRYEIDVDPKSLKDSQNNGVFDPNRVTRDDLRNSEFISSVQEMSLFQDLGVRSILIKDNLSKEEGLSEVSYKAEITVASAFREYIVFVYKEIQKAIKFLTGYVSDMSRYYNNNLKKFEKSYVTSTLLQLGIVYGENMEFDTSTSTIGTSPFGQAAKAYHNCSLLLSDKVSLDYQKLLNKVLPINNTTPGTAALILEEFRNLSNKVNKVYDISKVSKRKQYKKPMTAQKLTHFPKTIIFASAKFKIDNDKLGYNIFSNKQKGMAVFQKAEYQQRFTSERSRYYNNFHPSSEMKALRPSEKAAFQDTRKNAAAFLTPIGLRMGEELLDTSRGLIALDPKKVKEFRLLKSIKAKKNKRAEKNNLSVRPTLGKAPDMTLSKFNIFIAPPIESLLKNGTVVNYEDHMIPAAKYVGEDSFFIGLDGVPVVRKRIKRLMASEEKSVLAIISDIIPRRFLHKKTAIKSIDEISISKPGSRLRQGILAEKINLADIPPQIKAMCTDSFTLSGNRNDPIKNENTSHIIQETQQNIFMIKALVGFDKDSRGFLNVHMPRYSKMGSDKIPSDRPILAKAYEYEIPELGIVKDKSSSTIYNNLIYIRN